VLTERGGMTSHAAVIARGMGLPCIVGASGIGIDARARDLRRMAAASARARKSPSTAPRARCWPARPKCWNRRWTTVSPSFWNGPTRCRDIGVRANADTPEDARTARMFKAAGHRPVPHRAHVLRRRPPAVMREMIFADRPEDRRVGAGTPAADAAQRFRAAVRDHGRAAGHHPPVRPALARIPAAGPRGHARAGRIAGPAPVGRDPPGEALSEFNPMLGMRGVRLGITVPEIYDMQARAIFEATIESASRGAPVVPEIMIPLVSARREVELVKTRIDAVAAAVRNKHRGKDFTYRLGVMVETPRAALRAGDIAQHAAFLSFGTNDLTQMTYGLSRDDAGRFMGTYVQQGVYPEDPFHILDVDGVGELVCHRRRTRPGA
jgi:pyruvate,orthophosphate dikinase